MKHMWSEEEIQSFKKDISNLVDSKGNPRFVGGDLTTPTIAGVEFTYAKWSLSGTHLMIVLAGNIANGTKLSNNTIIATSSLEAWILSKIYPVFANDAIEVKSLSLYGNDWSSQSLPIGFKKFNDHIELVIASGLTLSANRGFRIQFDLLIDSE